MQTTALKEIIAFLFGRKYYAIILAAWLDNATCPYIRKERNELDDPSKQIGKYDAR